jgi:hypothetical protein
MKKEELDEIAREEWTVERSMSGAGWFLKSRLTRWFFHDQYPYGEERLRDIAATHNAVLSRITESAGKEKAEHPFDWNCPCAECYLERKAREKHLPLGSGIPKPDVSTGNVSTQKASCNVATKESPSRVVGPDQAVP